MTEKFYKTRIHKIDSSTFGGIIYSSDFNTSYTAGNIAQRIISDKIFDKRCKRNLENQNRKMND